MLRKLLLICTLCFSFLAEAQVLIQTYTDRCTGATQVFQVPMNGSTVITFYDQSKSFTATDFQNGTLQSWLEGVYLSWRQLNPCSQNQAENNVIQNTVQQTTQVATQAATQATAKVPTIPQTNVPIQQTPTETPAVPTVETPAVEAPTPTVESTPQVDTSSQQTDTPISTESGSSGTETTENVSTESTGTTESSEAEVTPTESTETQEDSSPSSESSDEGSATDDGGDSGDAETSEETQESESESEVEETSEETTEEESTEETTEEESTEEESTEEESSEEEESTEEESKEESSEESEEEEEKKEEKKKKKKRNGAPPIIVANVSSMQGIDGKFQQAFTMGISKSSLKGDKTYGVTSMVWSNLKQYMVMGTFSKLFFKEGRPFLVYSAGIGASKMFSTVIGMNNHSLVLLGKKGLVAGTSLGVTSIYLNYDVTRDAIIFDDNIISGNATFFATKPYNVGRFTISPMLAASKQILNYSVYGEQTPVSKDLMYITGTSVNFALTKRFVANLGANMINNTNKNIRSTLTFTIGSRFSF